MATMVNPPHITYFRYMSPGFCSVFEINPNSAIFSWMGTMVSECPNFRRTLKRHLMNLIAKSKFMLHQGYLRFSVWNGLGMPSFDEDEETVTLCIPVVSATAAVINATSRCSCVGLNS